MGAVIASWAESCVALEPEGFGVLVHGGAGDVPVEARPVHAEGCRLAAVRAGDVLRQGGTALDAVEAAVRALEDDPHFNAGTGACLNEEGSVELDASIMDGTTLRFGGVCAMPPFREPITIARAVMDDGRHVLYAAEGAARFAVARGFQRVEAASLITENARARWVAAEASVPKSGGTVGAVARDRHGRVASATSTGGRVRKRIGRVGDSPIPGAGTYADDRRGACSTTGDGEAMLRACTARTAVDELRGAEPEVAARTALEELGRIGGTGGLVLIDARGRMAWARSTATMSWAAVGEGFETRFGA